MDRRAFLSGVGAVAAAAALPAPALAEKPFEIAAALRMIEPPRFLGYAHLDATREEIYFITGISAMGAPDGRR